MKYSIISEAVNQQRPLELQGLLHRVFSDYSSTSVLSVLPDNKIRLQNLSKFASTDHEEAPKSIKKSFEVSLTEQVDWRKLSVIWCGQNQWILVLSGPLRIFYVIQKYSSCIPIQLQQQLNLTQMSCYVNFPDVYIYGAQENSSKHTMYCLNLTTFQIKTIKPTKDYGPQKRIDPWCFFSDSRLYIAGGTDKQKKQIDELLWTYTLDNGYWFALELVSEGPQLNGSAINCEYENGKVVSICNNKLYLVELYQSRARQIDNWSQIISPQKLETIQGVFVSNGWIYFQAQTGLYPSRLKIAKGKEQ